MKPGLTRSLRGLDAKDAVIGVTQGAVERLKRQELQGIIAHEFSHIQNGDMRLNIQLLGVLTGVQAITLAGRFLLRRVIGQGAGLASYMFFASGARSFWLRLLESHPPIEERIRRLELTASTVAQS